MKPAQITKILLKDAYLHLLVYGQPGSGKTPFLSTGPKTLILECDRGDASAAVLKTTAEKWVINDWHDMSAAYEYVRHEGVNEYEWVWIDSMTLFQERGLDHIMQDLVARKPHRKVYLPDKGEYGENMNRVSLLVRDFKTLPINFGITAHIARVEDEDGDVTYMPHIQGRNMPQKISGYFDVVALMEMTASKGQIQPVLRTKPDQKHKDYYIRDRFNMLSTGAMLNPTVPKVMAAFKKATEAVKPPVAPKKAVAKKTTTTRSS
jgi:AAA domain